MLRLLVSLLPTVLAVGVALVALKMPAQEKPEEREERSKKLLAIALAMGLLVSIITYSQVRTGSSQAESDRIAQQTTEKVTFDLKSQFQGQIDGLNKQIASLQKQLAALQPNKPEFAPASAGSAAPGTSGLPQIYWTQTKLKDSADVQVSFKIYGALDLPAFVAICDGPCTTTQARAGSASEGTQLQGSAGNNVAGYVFKKPRPMPAGTEGYLLVRGGKGEVKIKDFKILEESEVPASLK